MMQSRKWNLESSFIGYGACFKCYERMCCQRWKVWVYVHFVVYLNIDSVFFDPNYLKYKSITFCIRETISHPCRFKRLIETNNDLNTFCVWRNCVLVFATRPRKRYPQQWNEFFIMFTTPIKTYPVSLLKPEEKSTRATSRMFFAASPWLKLPDYLDSKKISFWQVLRPRQTFVHAC